MIEFATRPLLTIPNETSERNNSDWQGVWGDQSQRMETPEVPIAGRTAGNSPGPVPFKGSLAGVQTPVRFDIPAV